MSRLGLAIRTGFTAVLLSAASVTMTVHAHAQGAISVAPGEGPAGTAITLSWNGFDDCTGPVMFTWDGAALATGSRSVFGFAQSSVPVGAKPGGHVIAAGCAGRTFHPTTTFVVTPPVSATTSSTAPTTTSRVGTTTPPTTRSAPAAVTSAPPATATAAPSLPSAPESTTSTPTSTPPAAVTSVQGGDALLTLSSRTIRPGEEFTAYGRGCPPNSRVLFFRDGVEIDAGATDSSGAFTQKLAFHTVAPGRHTVTADCGVRLTAAVDEFTSTSVGGTATVLVVLIFFVFGGVGLVRLTR